MSKLEMSSHILQIPLTLSNRICAANFANQQSSNKKRKQVYQNTLSVAAVNTYLQYLGWTTNLPKSNSWNPILQTLLDTADILVSERGKLECRSVFSQAKSMIIPEEVSTDRIAYIAVNIDGSQNFAQLLGFTSEINSLTVPLNGLKPMNKLPEFLEKVQQEPIIPKLSHWLWGIVEAGWNKLDSLTITQPDLVFRINASQLNFRTKVMQHYSTLNETEESFLNTGVSRVKLWNLEQKEYDSKIAFIISLLPSKNDELEISVKVCPINENNYLPEGLLVKILDEKQQPILQAQTKAANENIEFFLSGETGEVFSIQAILNDEIQTESFII